MVCPRGSHVPAASCCALGSAGWEKETAAQPGQCAGAADQRLKNLVPRPCCCDSFLNFLQRAQGSLDPPAAQEPLRAAKPIASSADVVLSSADTPPASPAAKNNPPRRRKPEEEGTMPSPPAEASVRPPPDPPLCFEPVLRQLPHPHNALHSFTFRQI